MNPAKEPAEDGKAEKLLLGEEMNGPSQDQCNQNGVEEGGMIGRQDEPAPFRQILFSLDG